MLELKWAYLQLEMHSDARLLLTINTHRGSYQYNRMEFGVVLATAIWQSTMNVILAGIPHSMHAR